MKVSGHQKKIGFNYPVPTLVASIVGSHGALSSFLSTVTSDSR